MKVFKLFEDAMLPTVKFKGDAGMDFYAYDNWEIPAHRYKVIGTGVGVIVPDGYVGILKPKGGNNWMLGAGVVDSNYRGEILFKIWNTYDESFTLLKNEPLGQMVVLKCLDIEIEEVRARHVDHTNRGATGGIVDQTIGKWD